MGRQVHLIVGFPKRLDLPACSLEDRYFSLSLLEFLSELGVAQDLRIIDVPSLVTNWVTTDEDIPLASMRSARKLSASRVHAHNTSAHGRVAVMHGAVGAAVNFGF